MTSLLKELTEIPGVAGAEDEVRAFIGRELRNVVQDVWTDALGNVFARKPAARQAVSALRVMVAAHMDEVGLMITHIEENGRLKFQPVGGMDQRVLLSKTVRIGKHGVPGVIGVKPIHLLKPEERDKAVKTEDMTIDIGANNRRDAEGYVKIGDYASFATEFGTIGNLIAAKALDDRAGCALLLNLLKGEYEFELVAVFTVQEEVGLRGAHVAAYSIRPDVAIVLEGTIADDLPKKRDESPTSKLGGGPAITLVDRMVVVDRGLVEMIIRSAEDNSIPFQIKQPLVGATDAGPIQRTGAGVRSAVVAVPCRYLHTPVSLMDPIDYENTSRLIGKVLARLPEWARSG